MKTIISNIEIGIISNVRKSGDEEFVYFADVDISPQEGFPMESHLYCARSNDYAITGKWIYEQILAGNFEGDLIQLKAGDDPITGMPFIQPPEKLPA